MIFYLHGELGELFGEKWELDVKTVSEGLRAMFVNTKGKMEFYFRQHAQDFFIVRDGDFYLGDRKDFDGPAGTNEVHIMPAIKGSGAAARIVAGIILIAAAFVVGIGNPVGLTLLSLGASLVLGGIVELLTPIPKQTETENTSSYFFNNGLNSIRQNSPIPVGYGRYMVFGQPISLQLRNEDIKPGSISSNAQSANSALVKESYRGNDGVNYYRYVAR